MAADLSGDVDYTMMLPDQYLPPPEDYGAYILEEPEPDPVRGTSLQDPSDLRMRGWMPRALQRGDPPFRHARPQRRPQHGGSRKKEGFRSDYGERYWAKQRARIPSQTLLKSDPRGYIELENVDWDERPPGFRPDDDIYYSDFYPHRGAQRTLKTLAQIPTNSEAVSRVEVDPSTVDLRPCGFTMKRAHAKETREKFETGATDGGIVPASLKIASKVVLLVCLMILAVILAIFFVGSAIALKAIIAQLGSERGPKSVT